jgi:phage head maturation protease
MNTITAPKGWRQGQTEHRFAGGSPTSYNATDHTAECVISAGAEVTRVYGKEILEISRKAIDLSRMPVPLLDSHNQASIDNVLGVIESAWVSDNKLYGRIRFAQTRKGKLAEGMVARGELSGVSAGYAVKEWRVTDSDGALVDENNTSWDDDLTYTATRWQLFEGSLVGVPADILSAVRKLGNGSDFNVADTIARMEARQRMSGASEVSDIRSRMRARVSDLEYDDEDVSVIIDRIKKKQKMHDELQALLADAEIAEQQSGHN